MPDSIITFDTTLFLLLNTALAHPLTDAFFLTITDTRVWIVPLLLMAALYLRVQRRTAVAGIVLGLITVAFTDPFASQIIKPLVGRLRPCHPHHFVEGARFLLGYKHSFSFPSSHAVNWCAQAMLFSRLHPRCTPVAWAIAVAVSYSRIHVGVHYPLDVLGGMVIGAGAGYAIHLIYKRLLLRMEHLVFWKKKHPLPGAASADDPDRHHRSHRAT